MRILTHRQLSHVAPAVFAPSPANGVSSRYGFVPTIEVLEALQTQGWYPVAAHQSEVRDGARQDVSQHLVRLRPEPDCQQIVGDSVAELVLTNSHDRTTAFQLELGVFRQTCRNALITPLEPRGSLRVRHAPSTSKRVVEGALALSEQVPRLSEVVEGLQSTLVARADAERLAAAVLAVRYGEDASHYPITPADLLTIRREEDANASVWSVFNRLHENLFKGGLLSTSQKGRRVRTRAIRGVGETLRLNRALWRLTSQFVSDQGVVRHG